MDGADRTLLQKTLTQLGIFAVFAAPGYAVAAFTMDRLGRGCCLRDRRDRDHHHAS